jgi:hypothetical protein
MAVTTNKVVRLTFLTSGGKTFAITLTNPKTGLTKVEAEAVMDTLITKDVFITASGALAAKRDIKVINTETDDLYDPPEA